MQNLPKVSQKSGPVEPHLTFQSREGVDRHQTVGLARISIVGVPKEVSLALPQRGLIYQYLCRVWYKETNVPAHRRAHQGVGLL